jgi:Protein of unknown function (DUF2637)
MSTRTLRTLTWLLVGTIAVIAVSFEAISQYAVAVGAFPRSLRYCAPLLVDAFTVAAGLVILARARDGVRAVYAWSLVAVASAVSVALNVAHAPHALAAQLVAALPPAALLASLELVLSEARRSRTAPQSASPDPAPQPAGRSAQEPAPLPRRRPRAAVRTSQDARLVVRELLAHEGDERVTARHVMAAAGVGERRAYELLREERAAKVTPSRNGDGG